MITHNSGSLRRNVTRMRDHSELIRSFDPRQRPKTRDAVLPFYKANCRKSGGAKHVLHFNNRWTSAVTEWIIRDVKHIVGRPPTRWPEFFTKTRKTLETGNYISNIKSTYINITTMTQHHMLRRFRHLLNLICLRESVIHEELWV